MIELKKDETLESMELDELVSAEEGCVLKNLIFKPVSVESKRHLINFILTHSETMDKMEVGILINLVSKESK